MPCTPHFHDHFIPSPDIVLRKKDDTPAAAAAAAPTGPQPCCQHTETRIRSEFKQVVRAILETLLPFNEAYQAVRSFMARKAAEELQALKQLNPQVA